MNYFKTTVLLAVLTAFLIFMGDAFGGRQGAIIALIFAGMMNVGSYWMFIVSPLSGGGMRRLFSAHPPMEERIRRLKEMAGTAV